MLYPDPLSSHINVMALLKIARMGHPVLRGIAGAVDDPNGMCTIGRSVQTYQSFFPNLTLVTTAPRRIEPTYARPDVGTFMLFQKGSA